MALSLVLFFVLFIQIVTGSDPCQGSCGRNGQEIRFPFGLKPNVNRCSYPGFNILSCNDDQTQTILTLPRSGNFTVQFIDYPSQLLVIRDPEYCLAKRFLDSFDLSGSPFLPEYNRTFAFLSCPSNVSFFVPGLRFVNCLSNKTYTVVAMPTDIYEEHVPLLQLCTLMSKTVPVPVTWPRLSEGDTRLLWSEPDCMSCEQRGGTCGFKSDTSLDLGCFNTPHSNGMFFISSSYSRFVQSKSG